jgi:hypothetical protein
MIPNSFQALLKIPKIFEFIIVKKKKTTANIAKIVAIKKYVLK